MKGTLVFTLLPSCIVDDDKQPSGKLHLDATAICREAMRLGSTILAATQQEIIVSQEPFPDDHRVNDCARRCLPGLPVVQAAFIADGQPVDWRDFRRKETAPPPQEFPRRARITFS